MPQSSTEPRNQGIQSKNPIRIVIGEDTFLMREALERIVSGFDYIDAVALCGDRDSLIAAIAQSLVLTKRAVEKHINAIFTKLELESPDDVSRRVKAALLFLASGNSPTSD